MRIGEVAEKTGLPASTLRYYESVGLLPKPARQSGQRSYAPSILKQIALVEVARASGFTITEVHQLLRGFTSKTPPSKRWRVLAEQKAVEIDERMEDLLRMKHLLKLVLACECPTFDACAQVIQDRRRG